MPFLDRIGCFCDQWGQLRVVVIIRQPGATLRSWRESFGWPAGLDNASADPWFALFDRVPACDDPLERRAHLWRVIVEEALHQTTNRPQQVMLVCYEDLLDTPQEVMVRVFRHIRAPDPETPIDVSDVHPQQRPQYKDLSAEETAMIDRICGSTYEKAREAASKDAEIDDRRPVTFH